MSKKLVTEIIVAENYYISWNLNESKAVLRKPDNLIKLDRGTLGKKE